MRPSTGADRVGHDNRGIMSSSQLREQQPKSSKRLGFRWAMTGMIPTALSTLSGRKQTANGCASHGYRRAMQFTLPIFQLGPSLTLFNFHSTPPVLKI